MENLYILILMLFLFVIALFLFIFSLRRYFIMNKKIKKAKSEADLAKLKLMLVQKELETIVDLMLD